jgi:hypothetical protein
MEADGSEFKEIVVGLEVAEHPAALVTLTV